MLFFEECNLKMTGTEPNSLICPYLIAGNLRIMKLARNASLTW